MLGQHFWKSATSALSTFNENISNALDNLDLESFAEEPPVSKAEGVDDENELDSYKKMLEEAQLQHVQLSKKLGLLIAQKDAELNIYREKCGEITKEDRQSGGADISSLLHEKLMLEESFNELRSKYQESLSVSNEAKVYIQKLEILQRKYDEILEEFQRFKLSSESRDRQKSETIDSLVKEYSQLAAEMELKLSAELKISRDLSIEKERLTLKVKALEQNIIEFADRAAQNSPVRTSSTSNFEENTSRTDSNSSLTAVDSQFNTSLEVEIKELRAKVVTLQFDLHEKEKFIATLQAQLNYKSQSNLIHENNNSSSSSAENCHEIEEMQLRLNDMEDRLSKKNEEIVHFEQDRERWSVERKENEGVILRLTEQNRSYRKEVEELRKQEGKLKNELESASLVARNSNQASETSIRSWDVERADWIRKEEKWTTDSQNLQQRLQESESKLIDVEEAWKKRYELASQQSMEKQQLSEQSWKSQLQTADEKVDILRKKLERSEFEWKEKFEIEEKSKTELQIQLKRLQEDCQLEKESWKALEGNRMEQGHYYENQLLDSQRRVRTLEDQLSALGVENKRVLEELTLQYEQKLVDQGTTMEQHWNAKMKNCELEWEKNCQSKLFQQEKELEKKYLQQTQGDLNELMSKYELQQSEMNQHRDLEYEKMVEAHTKDVEMLKLQHLEDKNTLTAHLTEVATQERLHQDEIWNGKLVSLRQELEADKEKEMTDLRIQSEKHMLTLKNDHEIRMQDLTQRHAKEMEVLKTNLEESYQRNMLTLKNDHETRIQDLTQRHSKEMEVLKLNLEESNQRNMSTLKNDHEIRLQDLTQRHSKEMEVLKTNLEESNQRNMSTLKNDHEVRIQDLTQQHAKEMEVLKLNLEESYQRNISTLKNTLKNDHEARIQDLTQQHAKEMEVLKSTLEESYQQELIGALKLKDEESGMKIKEITHAHENTLQELNKEMMNLKNEIVQAEQRFEERLKSAIRILEEEKEVIHSQAMKKLEEDMQALIQRAEAEREEYLQLYTKENRLRKSVHNKLLELQGNIRVFCRVRPIVEAERRVAGETDVDVTSFPGEDELVVQRDAHSKSRFEFDKVFRPGSTQEEVFNGVQPLCVSVLDGFNICIFAYGQTGSGKTFTMDGYKDLIGVSPRAVQELFRLVKEMESEWTYSLTFSMLEIYNETILDLLNISTREKLEVRQAADGNNVIPGLTEVVVTSESQVMSLIKQGQSNRAVGSHDMNEHSSRSHSILTIVCKGKNKIDGTTTFGKLNLIDLAGSERVGKTDATGDRLKEAQNINRSLSALGDVIQALGNKKATHVPYRNSKLTFLLQDSLGGNSKVLMFVNISPAVYNVGETICSLNFAGRCRAVELGQAKRQIGTGSDDNPAPSVSSTSSTSGVGTTRATTATTSSIRRLPTTSSSGSLSSTAKK